jgi:hypothetical protein
MDMNTIPDRYPNLTIEELEIIGYFARGQKHSFSSKNLKLDFSETSIRLSDRQGKLLGISKQVNESQRKALVSNDSNYHAKIVEVLTERGFIAKEKSSHPDFTEYHYYQVPDGYKLNYTKILQIWKVWWKNKCNALSLRDAPGTEKFHQGLHSQTPIGEPLIFSKGNWHQIQNLQPQQEDFLLQMVNGDPMICAEDSIVWIDKLPTLSSPVSPQPTSEQISSVQPNPVTLSKSPTSNMPIQVVPSPIVPISPLQMSKKEKIDRNSQHDEDADLEVYLSTFNTEDTEDVDRIEGIYNIGELLSDSVPENEVLPASPPAKSRIRLQATAIDTPVDNQPILESPSDTQLKSAPIVPPPPPKTPNLMSTSKAPNPNPNPNPLTPSPKISVPAQSVSNSSNPNPVIPSPKVSVTEPSVASSAIELPSTISTSQPKKLLKVKAFETLSKYLREGERVTHTETIKNTQGEVINRKTIEIQRGCPSWAIDLIQSL